MSDVGVNKKGTPGSLEMITERLIAPSPHITDTQDQQRARLSASITLFASALTTLGFLISELISGDLYSVLRIFGPILLISFGSYFLSRSRYTNAGAFLFVLGFCAMPYILIISGNKHSAGQMLLIFLPLGLIVGSFILSTRGLLTILFLAVGGFIMLGVTGIRISADEWAAFGSILAVGFSLVVFGKLRANSEKNNLEILSRANAELDAMGHLLEVRVAERTEALNRRTAQLEAASYVSRQTASIMDASILLSEVVQLISDRFDFYHAGIFLLDPHGRYAILQAASSDGGKRMVARGHRLEVGREGIVGYTAYQKRARIALDVGTDAVYFSNPDLPHTRSEMALPLVVRGKVIGVLDIQSTEPSAFSEEDVNALQSLADQIALALDNDRLLADSRAALKELQTVTSESSYRSWQERLKGQKTAFRYTPVGVSAKLPGKDLEEVIEDTQTDSIAFPISLRGKEIGQVVAKRRGRNWSEHEQTLVSDIAAQVALALENARLLEDLQRRANREQVISQAAARFSQTTDLDKLLKLALQEFHQLPSVEEVSVTITQSEDSILSPQPAA